MMDVTRHMTNLGMHKGTTIEGVVKGRHDYKYFCGY